MTDRPIRAILDASAIGRYVRGGGHAIHVGEVLVQVDDGAGVAGLPVLCMAQALRDVGAGLEDRFQLLIDHPATEIVVGPEDWQAVAVVMDLVGRWDVAVAASWRWTSRPRCCPASRICTRGSRTRIW